MFLAHCYLSWCGMGTSIKSGGIKLVLLAQSYPLSEMMRSCKCFHMWVKYRPSRYMLLSYQYRNGIIYICCCKCDMKTVKICSNSDKEFKQINIYHTIVYALCVHSAYLVKSFKLSFGIMSFHLLPSKTNIIHWQ